MVGITTALPSRRGPASASGKFLHVANEPFLVRGVAYGSFAPRTDGREFPSSEQVRHDFALMAACGINTVRTYTVPPPDVLDAAEEHGLRVMAGLAWTQHVAFLEDRHLRREIIRTIAEQARAIADHPALLLTAIGNEIPPAVVRWHGRTKIETFIRAAADAVRSAAPGMLVTYVNYPPTEFLELPFLDVHAFNVYLHDEPAMRAYVARLQHLAGNAPLLLAECGADSIRLGQQRQAAVAAMQIRVAFSEGACGAVVFGWTDDWWRGGAQIDDWAFGLVDRHRKPKVAHDVIAETFRETPFTAEDRALWPTVSVVVCAYNAALTIDDCLASLERVDYPRFEVIVVDDGSTDDTASRTAAYSSVRLLQVPNGGLSAARNIGMQAAAGEIVVYVDADVRVEPSWLGYLVQPFVTSDAVAAGGPNVVPADDDWFAQCVARSPGGPNHVLLDDRVAEHIPGCNFAVRRDALQAMGGFDPIFLRAGDDVDACWRLQDRGGVIAFSPAALVWHHHRGSLRAYWRQQVGYGEGEAWLRSRHAGRFSRSAVAWRGRIYSALPFVRSLSERRLHSGVWGTAAFPTVYHTGAHPIQALPHTPEWQLIAAALVLAGMGGLLLSAWTRASAALIALGLSALATTLLKCIVYALDSDVERLPSLPSRSQAISRAYFRATIALLHVVQPFARAYGYLRGSLRQPDAHGEHAVPIAAPPHDARHELALLLGRAGHLRFWSEAWTSGDALLTEIVERFRGLRFGRGIQVDDGWRPDRDISIALGCWGWAHLQALVEDHGTGRCLFRVRMQIRPRLAFLWLLGAAAAFVTISTWYGRAATAIAVVAVLVGLYRTLRTVVRDMREVLHILTTVANDYGMRILPPRGPNSRPTWPSSWRRLPATHGG